MSLKFLIKFILLLDFVEKNTIINFSQRLKIARVLLFLHKENSITKYKALVTICKVTIH